MILTIDRAFCMALVYTLLTTICINYYVLLGIVDLRGPHPKESLSKNITQLKKL